MHCNGCKNLITMSLEDVGFTDIKINVQEGLCEFVSEFDAAETHHKANQAFSELPDYNLDQMASRPK